MFGKRRKSRTEDLQDSTAEAAVTPETAEIDDAAEDAMPTTDGGPYDIDDVSDPATLEQRLDLGSVLLPVPPGSQLQVEMAPDGSPQNVHLVTEHGRITVAAYAAPKSPGQWREVTADLAESLRNDNAPVSIETGPWGREVVTETQGASLRFIGVDGYRWMVRLVAAGPAGATAEDAPLTVLSRAVLTETVVRRGSEPHPVRTPLPVQLPQALAEQVAAAQQQQLAQMQGQSGQEAPAAEPEPEQETPGRHRQRRGAGGSAMQQLGR
ncbi:DUF3710 domain-containing protein [Skermania sp. ID1734]|uniref:DUF3710 domain-containing protein n=1 Tax=Skermania sp. ID1734 TaxID=2597516 RepID=UPI00117EBA78|nr:DUF3710 domain-containing protein [Skermania sp. ID1734]TSD96027.1 DUF3710 domain-containing protein [Skermania sp. ID1734]